MKGEYKTPFESNVHAPYERILVSQPLKIPWLSTLFKTTNIVSHVACITKSHDLQHSDRFDHEE